MIHEDDAVAEGSAAAISAAAVVADVVNFAAAEAPSTFPPPRLQPRHTQQQPLLPLHAQPVGEETHVCDAYKRQAAGTQPIQLVPTCSTEWRDISLYYE